MDPNIQTILLGLLTNGLTAFIAQFGRKDSKLLLGEVLLKKIKWEESALQPILLKATHSIAENIEWQGIPSLEIVCLFLTSPEAESIVRQIYATQFATNESGPEFVSIRKEFRNYPEHQVEEVCCPTCQQVSRGSFPRGVEAPVQYGPQIRALAVYLHEYQLVPLARVSELLADLYACEVSEGTVLRWVEWAAERLAPVVAHIADWLSASSLQHADETGLRIGGKLHWLHVNSTRFLTHLAWHAKRGRKALEDIGIWPRFGGRSMHDRWGSYDHYSCAHSICGAHVIRDCLYVSEQEEQEWAAEMADLLLSMAKAADEWRQLGVAAVPTEERDAWVAQYFDLLASGFAAQPQPSAENIPKRGGRRKQSATKNLLDDLLRRAEQVLAFLDDLSIPFTNNQAERDLRMVKVQQKIAGTFRSENGATAFCRIRSYLSTMRKQGHPMLTALAAVFAGQPLSIAWAPGSYSW